MILVPYPIFSRLIPHAVQSFEQCDGIPQANSISGRMILQAKPDSENVWSCWSISRDYRASRLLDWLRPLALPQWEYPLADEKTQCQLMGRPDRGTEPQCEDDQGAVRLYKLDVSCRLAYVSSHGSPWKNLPPWLKLVSSCRGPAMSRLFYVVRSKPDEMFQRGFSPQTRLRERATLRTPVGGEVIDDVTTGDRYKVALAQL